MWNIPVLFEDQDILLVNKPAGLQSQSSVDTQKENLYSLLQQQRNEKLFLHHRLDKDTSGVIMFGRHPRANKGLTDLFRDHLIQKTYIAIAKKPEDISNASWTIQDHLAPVRGQGKKQMRMVRVRSGGWKAQTDFKRLESLSDVELIEAKPHTGRTHQIRVHLAFEKQPILGDRLYGGFSAKATRLFLHAKSLSFHHPVTEKPLLIECELPAEFNHTLEKARAGEVFF